MFEISAVGRNVQRCMWAVAEACFFCGEIRFSVKTPVRALYTGAHLRRDVVSFGIERP
jgi:hypothetical protein